MMDQLERITTMSRRLRMTLLVFFWGLPILQGWLWLAGDTIPHDLLLQSLPEGIQQPLPGSTRVLGFVISMLGTGLVMYGIHILASLLRMYGEGQLYTQENVRCIRRLGTCLLWWFGAGLLQTPLLSVVLSWHHPQGERILSFAIGSPDVTVLILACMLRVVAWVMEVGQVLQAEQDLTI